MHEQLYSLWLPFLMSYIHILSALCYEKRARYSILADWQICKFESRSIHFAGNKITNYMCDGGMDTRLQLMTSLLEELAVPASTDGQEIVSLFRASDAYLERVCAGFAHHYKTEW
jgi:hypothetical protein